MRFHRLHEGNTATRCELATFEANTALITDMPFLSDRVVGQVIMASKDLTEVLQSIDTSSKHVSISFQVASQLSSARLPSKGEKGQSGEDTITSLADPVSVSDSTHAGAASMILATAESEDEEVAPPRISRAAASVPMMMIQSEGDSGSTQVSKVSAGVHRSLLKFLCALSYAARVAKPAQRLRAVFLHPQLNKHLSIPGSAAVSQGATDVAQNVTTCR